jgi:UDP-N-acetylmuramyl pentapeptide phosphotransferase/UDP-N-acetylglucosamine-1-phosphate transferase
MAGAPGVALGALLGGCFAIALLGTWLARRYALRRQLVDLPGERRSHRIPTPRGGGIAIVLALLCAIAWLIVQQPQHGRFLGAFATGCILVAGVGWFDDHRPLSPWWRLLVQALASALLAWGIAQDGGSAIAGAVGFAAAMVLVNVWNFMDGINGIATSQAILVCAAFGCLAWPAPQAWLASALVAGCAGFLPFNFPKARIFLGDVGSGALGFAIAGTGTWTATGDWASAPLLLLPLSAFMVDASCTLAARVARGDRWWLPHAEHAYQYWARRLQSHGFVTVVYAGWTFLACLFMFWSRNEARAFIIPAVTAVFAPASMIWAWSRWLHRRDEATEE